MVLMSGGDDFDLPEIGSRRRRSGRTYEWKLIKAGEGWDSPDNKDKFEVCFLTGMLIRSISNAIKPVSTTCWGCTFGINSLTPAAHTPAAGSRELKRVYDQQRRARTNPGSPLDKPATRCSRKITQMSLSPPSALCGDSDLNGVCTHTELNMSLPWQRKRQYSSSSSGFVIERRF